MVASILFLITVLSFCHSGDMVYTNDPRMFCIENMDLDKFKIRYPLKTYITKKYLLRLHSNWKYNRIYLKMLVEMYRFRLPTSLLPIYWLHLSFFSNWRIDLPQMRVPLFSVFASFGLNLYEQVDMEFQSKSCFGRRINTGTKRKRCRHGIS